MTAAVCSYNECYAKPKDESTLVCPYHDRHNLLTDMIYTSTEEKKTRDFVHECDWLEATDKLYYNEGFVPETDSDSEDSLQLAQRDKPERNRKQTPNNVTNLIETVTQIFHRTIEEKPNGTKIITEKEKRRTTTFNSV
jgi:hypothetical protein